jgi:PAS domain S-box-containing protein
MNKQGKPKRDLADEMESLRDEIARLQSLIQIAGPEARGPSAPGGAAAPAEASFPRTLLEDAPVGMALVGVHFNILKMNAAFRRMLGYPQEETQSLHIQDVAEDSRTCMQLITQVFGGVPETSKTEVRFIHKNGEKLWVQFTVTAIAETPENPKCCLILVEDINDRKWAEIALQTEKKLLERLINSSLDGIVAFDHEGFITVWNPVMERIFGVSKKDALFRPAFEACPFLVDLGEDVNITEAISGKKVISRDKSYTIPGSKTATYFEGYYGPMHDSIDGKVIGGLAIIRDVTERSMALEEERSGEEHYRELFENAYDMV